VFWAEALKPKFFIWFNEFEMYEEGLNLLFEDMFITILELDWELMAIDGLAAVNLEEGAAT